jgi:uncharacterized repeat protein (TIGR03809 family)
MAEHLDVIRGRALVERWCILAEQRLDYLTELYETGRWRRYHTEPDFIENIREAKQAVSTWRGILECEAGADNRPIDLSWLGRNPNLPPRISSFSQDAPVFEPAPELPCSIEVPAEEAPPVAPLDCLIAAVADEIDQPDGHEDDAPQSYSAPLNLEEIQRRYPLLRPTL